jgi:hypothetical protein
MLNSSGTPRNKRSPSAILVLLLLCLSVLTSGCPSLFGVKEKVEVPPVLPVKDATTDELMSEVNRLANVRSIRGKLDIQFLDTSFAESGIAEKYRTADGTVTLQRPAQIYLQIQGPFSVDIAQMTSDGAHFEVAVLKGDDKYRRFLRGTNSAGYRRMPVSEDVDPHGHDGKNREMAEQHAVSVLSNLRPQHFTDALLIRPIPSRAESGYIYSQSEVYREETDSRPQAKRGSRVVRGYYVLEELAPDGPTGARLIRRFWFDRVDKIHLARLQTYEDGGKLVTDVTYSDLKAFGDGGRVQLPSHIELERPQDKYKLSLTYQSPDAVVLDHDYNAATFVLENKWQLKEVDLDKQIGKQE